MTKLGSPTIPFHCLGIVEWHAFAVCVGNSEIEFGTRVVLVCGSTKPFHGRSIVLWGATTL